MHNSNFFKWYIYCIYTQKNNWRTFLLTLYYLRNLFSNIVILYLIELPLCNLEKNKNENYGSLVTIQYHSNVPALFTQRSQANNLALINFAAIFTNVSGHCLCSNSDHREVLTLIDQSLSLIIGQPLQQKITYMAYPSQIDNKLAVKHWQQLHS